MRTLAAVFLWVTSAAALAQAPVYWSRYEVLGWGEDVLAVREVYDASEAGGGREAVSCRYPGMKRPGEGVRLHFVRYALGVPLSLAEAVKQREAKTFVIYESTLEAKGCTSPEMSRERLEAAKAHAAAAGISLEERPKPVRLGEAQAFATDCFLQKQARSCSGAASASAPVLRYRMISAAIASGDRSACPVSGDRVEHGCAVSLRVDVEAGFADNIWSVSAAHAGDVGSGSFDFGGFEGFTAGEGAPRWLLKLNFRDRFLSILWERPVVVVLSAIG